MKPGDLVLVRFPRTDLKSGKLRPAVVIAFTPGRHPDVLLAMVSSQIYQAVPDFDELIEQSDSDFRKSGLKTDSVVRLSRLAVVDTTVVNARLGRISRSRLLRLRKRSAQWLSN